MAGCPLSGCRANLLEASPISRLAQPEQFRNVLFCRWRCGRHCRVDLHILADGWRLHHSADYRHLASFHRMAV